MIKIDSKFEQWVKNALTDLNRIKDLKNQLLAELENKYITVNLKNLIQSEIQLLDTHIIELNGRIDFVSKNSYMPAIPYQEIKIELKSI